MKNQQKHYEQPTIFVIGGVPRGGKSTLARRLNRQPGARWNYSLDVVHCSLAHVDPNNWDVERSRFAAAYEFSPLFRQVVLMAANDMDDSIFEGALILPCYATWLTKRG